MTALPYSLVEIAGQKNITVFVDGEVYVASDRHPNFDAILANARDGVKAVTDLFDVAKTVNLRFQRLSADVVVNGEEILYRGEPVKTPLATQILRFLDEQVQDFAPLVKFLEKIQANPNAHSRDQAWNFLEANKFTLTDDGDIVGYKGVKSDYASWHSGPGIVDGQEVTQVVSKPGTVVEMARTEVVHDPNRGCDYGLHVGSYGYADDFKKGGILLEVHVSPADIVSVPTREADSKMRVCRYKVVGPVNKQHTTAVLPKLHEAKDKTVAFNDTRLNHLQQERYPKGHPKAGRFKPKRPF